MPPHVLTAAALTLFLALYADAMSLPLCIGGAFTNMDILILGIGHAVLGTALLVARRGLLHRRLWARWFLLSVSALIASALPAWTVRECLKAGRLDGGALFVLVIAALFGLIALNLSSSVVSVWFKGKS
jgi:hypothetical protein